MKKYENETNYNEYFLLNPEAIDRIAGITFWGRSGSYLLCSLFDGHPEVLAVSPHSWAGLYERITEIKNAYKTSSTEELMEKIALTLPYLTREGNKRDAWSLQNSPGTTINKLGDTEVIEIGPEEEKFKFYLRQIFDHQKKKEGLPNEKFFLNSFHIAYNIALGRDIKSQNPIIILSLHETIENAIFSINSQYKDFYFIASVRCPHKSFDSHLFHHLYESTIRPAYRTHPILINHLINHGKEFEFMKSEKQLAVRFEDFHSNTTATMKKLSNKLNISWSPCLLESTIDSKKWWMDRNGELISGTNHSVAKSSSLKVLGKLDIHYIENILKSYYVSWNYEISQKSFFKNFFYNFIVYLPFSSRIFRKILLIDLKCYNKMSAHLILLSFYTYFTCFKKLDKRPPLKILEIK